LNNYIHVADSTIISCDHTWIPYGWPTAWVIASA